MRRTRSGRHNSNRFLRLSIAWRIAAAVILTALGAVTTPTLARADEDAAPGPVAARIKVLFLGDNGHHVPAERAAELVGPMAKVGIDVAYTDSLDDLNPSNLARYDALLIYANHEDDRPGAGAGAARIRRGRRRAGRRCTAGRTAS